MFNKTPLTYNERKVIYNSGNIRLQIDDLDELRKFNITYLADSNIMLELP